MQGDLYGAAVQLKRAVVLLDAERSMISCASKSSVTTVVITCRKET